MAADPSRIVPASAALSASASPADVSAGGSRAAAWRRGALIAFALFLAALPQLPVPEFWITQANYIGLYTLVVIGLVLLTGVAGLTSFAQAAFVGMGAYTAAYLTVTYTVSPGSTVLVGLSLSFLGALVVGWTTVA